MEHRLALVAMAVITPNLMQHDPPSLFNRSSTSVRPRSATGFIRRRRN
uniref:Uncharacterized protein n=1 Tax=Rhizophora mucronata TaxID=61149 RepID=A0A2P2P789_RHIMU